MHIVGEQIYGLRCPKCRLSSENMELKKADAESGVVLRCVECDVELVKDERAKPVLQNRRCQYCNITFSKVRRATCQYCGAELIDAPAGAMAQSANRPPSAPDPSRS